MLCKIDHLNINYHHRGRGDDILLLHGWGLSSQVFQPLAENLEDHNTVWTMDLPGFGQSDLPPQRWGNKEYVDLIHKFIETNSLHRPSLAGHSFGGALAAMFSRRHPEDVNKLILIDSAGGRPLTIKRILFWGMANLGKIIFQLPYLKKVQDTARKNFYRYIVQETDYLKSGHLKATFQKVIRRDLKTLYGNINTPTLIVWGENDKITPLKDGKRIHQLISQSQLKIIPECGHMCFLEKPQEVCYLIHKFLA